MGRELRLTLNEANDLPSATADLSQRVGSTPGGAGNGRSGGAGDARQALRGLGCGVLRDLGGLLGGGALEAAGGQLPDCRGAEHRPREGHGHCRGHLVRCGCVCVCGREEK